MMASGMSFSMMHSAGKYEDRTRLTGKVNVYNLLAASAAALARGLTLEEIAAGAAALDRVPGRFQTVDAGQPFTVVVDYAHTDDALKNLIALAREFVTAKGGRVITLFGCGGDRDRTKRPLMGRAASEGSDFVVFTSDNPRSEDPMKIVARRRWRDGTTDARYVEPDRAVAIRIAIGEAKPGDIVLLAGKGHEKVQVLSERTIPFDDAEVARRVAGLARAGERRMKLRFEQIGSGAARRTASAPMPAATGYSIDSRTIAAGELFFAVKGERFDGHDFVAAAMERGAIAAVVDAREGLASARIAAG